MSRVKRSEYTVDRSRLRLFVLSCTFTAPLVCDSSRRGKRCSASVEKLLVVDSGVHLLLQPAISQAPEPGESIAKLRSVHPVTLEASSRVPLELLPLSVSACRGWRIASCQWSASPTPPSQRFLLRGGGVTPKTCLLLPAGQAPARAPLGAWM